MVRVACPELRVCVPNVVEVEVSVNVTVPVGVPVPEDGVTEAVNVTPSPIMEGFAEDDKVVAEETEDWNSSALARMSVALLPPATSTLPLPSRTASWAWRALVKLAVGVKVFVIGSKSSALASMLLLASWPPAKSTLPPLRRVAVCNKRAVVMLPVAEKVPVVGS